MKRPLIPNSDVVVAVIGLGYVGLPLAVAFARRCRTIGFDLSAKKIAAYKQCHDPTGEVPVDELARVLHPGGFEPTGDPAVLAQADFLIVAVPTPVDAAHNPDFRPLIGASRTVGAHLRPGATIVYESTVFPGATEEICIPELQKASGLTWKKDFNVGYSPERINPGDKEHTLTRIVKVVSGDTPQTLETVAAVYGSIIEAGIHRAPSIKVAEAAKVIENTQRDLNIALMNELAIIFDRIGVDTGAVLEAAGTKWNFLKFRPGLVGGHCIGVDPYYLTHKAEITGYHPQVILAGRRINDGMGKFIAEKTIKLLINRGSNVRGAKVLVMGLTFKEDCPDIRNSKVADLIAELKSYGCDVMVTDPLADPVEAQHEYRITLLPESSLPAKVDAIVLAVAHREYRLRPWHDYEARLSPTGVLVDVKGGLAVPSGHPAYWRL
jgi:UDP-N-acetyl-D-galactosamine dehydrogenase